MLVKMLQNFFGKKVYFVYKTYKKAKKAYFAAML